MASAFQETAFQLSAFQTIAAAVPEIPGVTILQRHKVDRLLKDVGITRNKYRDYQKQWSRDAINAQRELKRKKRREVDAPLGYAKIEYDKYGYRVAAGEAAFHDLIRGMEMEQTLRAQQQAQLFAQDAAARLNAVNQFNQKAVMGEKLAQLKQFARDTDEEQEALEIAMMDD